MATNRKGTARKSAKRPRTATSRVSKTAAKRTAKAATLARGRKTGRAAVRTFR